MLLDLLFHHNRILEPPPAPTGFPQPYKQERQATLPRRVAAHVVVTASTVRVVLTDPTIFAKTRLSLASNTVSVSGTDIIVRAGVKTALRRTALSAKMGTILASGRHDLSDEELITMFLELLD